MCPHQPNKPSSLVIDASSRTTAAAACLCTPLMRQSRSAVCATDNTGTPRQVRARHRCRAARRLACEYQRSRPLIHPCTWRRWVRVFADVCPTIRTPTCTAARLHAYIPLNHRRAAEKCSSESRLKARLNPRNPLPHPFQSFSPLKVQFQAPPICRRERGPHPHPHPSTNHNLSHSDAVHAAGRTAVYSQEALETNNKNNKNKSDFPADVEHQRKAVALAPCARRAPAAPSTPGGAAALAQVNNTASQMISTGERKSSKN